MINRRQKIIKKRKNCPFCKTDTQPDYRNVAELAPYLSNRGKILSLAKTGICAKHQRKLTKQIKRARHLALLPYTI